MNHRRLKFIDPIEETVPPEAVWSGPGDLTDVAIRGRCVIVDRTWEYWRKGREGKDYRSDVLVDPTWQDLLSIATEVIKTTGDWHHVFLECVEEVTHDLEVLSQAFGEEEPVKVYRLGLGS